MYLLVNRANKALFKLNWGSCRYGCVVRDAYLSAHKVYNQSPTSTTTYKRDGKLHKFVIELDYGLYTQFAIPDPTLPFRLYGQVFSGAARTNYPGFEQVADTRPGSPGTQYVYTLFSANRKRYSTFYLIYSHMTRSTSLTTGEPSCLIARSMDPGAPQV